MRVCVGVILGSTSTPTCFTHLYPLRSKVSPTVDSRSFLAAHVSFLPVPVSGIWSAVYFLFIQYTSAITA